MSKRYVGQALQRYRINHHLYRSNNNSFKKVAMHRQIILQQAEIERWYKYTQVAEGIFKVFSQFCIAFCCLREIEKILWLPCALKPTANEENASLMGLGIIDDHYGIMVNWVEVMWIFAVPCCPAFRA